jgi:hypothetical protein
VWFSHKRAVNKFSRGVVKKWSCWDKPASFYYVNERSHADTALLPPETFIKYHFATGFVSLALVRCEAISLIAFFTAAASFLPFGIECLFALVNCENKGLDFGCVPSIRWRMDVDASGRYRNNGSKQSIERVREIWARIMREQMRLTQI